MMSARTKNGEFRRASIAASAASEERNAPSDERSREERGKARASIAASAASEERNAPSDERSREERRYS